ncbi:hypothetical protein NHX12_023397 [Muraenolepis orangiensis]|uniref:Uncharacterized protein n=1 Tax=Muraenolepis orangiensis TaxID=630683 RepID=A0A9Q0EMH7_9TELE|nr:hypothetical protein NHX12_023113 [Muraenolepis orangiensis]KAJ3608867.1 hypothetical protein NHX12_023397 [Muraenolepis orangiensis]
MDWEPYRYHVRTIPLYLRHLQSPGTVSVSRTTDITGVHSTDTTDVPTVHTPDNTGVPIGDGDGHGTLSTRALVWWPPSKDMETVDCISVRLANLHIG